MVAVFPTYDAPPGARTIRQGDALACPNCGHTAPTWDWRPLSRPAAYRHELVPVFRCPVCRHIFAPAPER